MEEAITWTYESQPIENISDMPVNTYGFIYEVEHIPSGRRYLGKKVLYFERNKRLGIRALAALKEERKLKSHLEQIVITDFGYLFLIYNFLNLII